MSSLHFRLATQTDLPTIRDILNQAIRRGGCNAFIEEVDLTDREQWFIKHPANKFPIYVVEVRDQVIGWISFSGYRTARKALAGVSEITYYLDENWQGQGHGQKLLEFLVQEGKRLQFEHLLAILMDTNTASVRLLERVGFAKWAHLPNIAKGISGRSGQLYYGLDIRNL